MAEILYSSTNNICSSDARGSIIIDQINFTQAELASFASYNIVWSGNFDDPAVQISEDKRIAQFLKNGNYSFTINSLINSSILGPYNITIVSSSQLSITNLKVTPYICSNEAGIIDVSISGGTPPYIVFGGSSTSESINSTQISLSGLQEGVFSVSVNDANNCSYTWPSEIEIKNATISIENIETIAPTLLDNYGILKMTVNGYGPFSFSFLNNDTSEIIYLDLLETNYIVESNETQYKYRIYDKLFPGSYSLEIKNNYGCSITTTIDIPNILPLSVITTITNNNSDILYNPELTLPIFDTIFIPYHHIQNNTPLWQFVQKLTLKDIITIKINDEARQLRIVRTMLDKHCLEDNQIEILRLDNNSKNWFFYFYVAPSVNITEEPNLLAATYKIIDEHNNDEYDLILGLNKDGSIDSEIPSLLRGSFILSGVNHNQFVNENMSMNFVNKKNNAYVNIGQENLEEYEHIAKNVTKTILSNLYLAGYVTTINFLEQFNRLNIYVNVNDTACNMSMEDYAYIINVKNLLKTINNFNNLDNIYIYNLDNILNIGQVAILLVGNEIFALENGELVENKYDISYYTFDSESSSLKGFYRNNELIKDTTLDNLNKQYIIVRVKDIYGNKIKIIDINGNNIPYDQHFTAAKNIIQKFNKKITDYFEYGDMLVYIGSTDDPLPPIDDPVLPKPPVEEQPEPDPGTSTNIVYQTPDTSNTSSLIVTLYKDIKCLMRGPKNYRYEITQNTEFRNMIPGIYTIVGEDSDLYSNYLYQQEHRILIEKNTTNTIDVDFISYRDQIFIKDF